MVPAASTISCESPVQPENCSFPVLSDKSLLFQFVYSLKFPERSFYVSLSSGGISNCRDLFRMSSCAGNDCTSGVRFWYENVDQPYFLVALGYHTMPRMSNTKSHQNNRLSVRWWLFLAFFCKFLFTQNWSTHWTHLITKENGMLSNLASQQKTSFLLPHESFLNLKIQYSDKDQGVSDISWTNSGIFIHVWCT